MVRDICNSKFVHEYFTLFLIFGGNVLSCLHQSEYQRGVSAWNFDIEDLKAQASLVSNVLLIFINYQVSSY